MKRRPQIIGFVMIINILFLIPIPLPSFQTSISDESFFPLSENNPIIQQAITYLKQHQADDGSIGGFHISPWVSMAFAAVNEDSPEFDKLTQYLLKNIDLLNQSGKPSDWQRHILGILARNNSLIHTKTPWLTEKLFSFYQQNQFGEPNNIYDDCFGLFALIGITNNSLNQTMIKSIKETIKEKQQENGGWNDVDTTSIAIMALRLSEEPINSTVFQNAYSFIKNHQDETGGFISWESVNTATTAWAISALTTLSYEMMQTIWNTSTANPLDFLLSMQQPDGSFNYTSSSETNSLWMTAYAIIALRGKSFPVTFLSVKSVENTDINDHYKKNDEDSIDYSNERKSDQSNHSDDCKSYKNHYFHILKPNINGVYINNKFLNVKTQRPIIIGPTTFIVKTNASIDFVTFSIDNKIQQIRYSEPFTFTYDEKRLCTSLILSVKGYTLRDGLTEQQLINWTDQIRFAKEIRENEKLNQIFSFFELLKQFENWLFPDCYHDLKRYLYINPFSIWAK
jgi:prenyltransferase beta subunit